MESSAFGIGGDSHELRIQLRQTWITGLLVAPLVGPLGIGVFWTTAIPLSALVWWSVAHLFVGLLNLGALLADRSDRLGLAYGFDWAYRFGMGALMAALPWMGPGVAGAEPDVYILALAMVIASAGSTMTLGQFPGRSTFLLLLVVATNLSYAAAFAVNQSWAVAGISLLWTVLCVVLGRAAVTVNIELVRLRSREETAARQDHLTGLLNRQGFFEELARNGERRHRLAVVDLDRFKLINDSLGHRCGDHVLVEVARRLEDTLPASATIGRIGGDEFAALVAQDGPIAEARPVFTGVVEALERPIPFEERILRVGASVGVTDLDQGSSPSESLAQADLAMYRSKRATGSSITFFDRSLREQLHRRVELEQRLRTALSDGSIEFWGQCIVSGKDRRPTAVELLARWRNDGVMVSPAEFIPIAEEIGLTVDLGRLALDTAADLLGRWEDDPDLASIEVNVNVSPIHLAAGLIDDVTRRFPREAQRLGVEFVESGLISWLADDRGYLDELRETGARVVIDDFGIGYSSLGYLWNLPLDSLKIDKSFIDNVAGDRVRSQLLSAVVTMADALELPCVAEGVECDVVLDLLDEMGVASIQGFAIHRPEPLDSLEASLRLLVERSRTTSPDSPTPTLTPSPEPGARSASLQPYP